MANNLLTPLEITRESLRVLHQECNFLGSVNRAHDSSFAKSGAKIGTLLNVRLPVKYTVRTGAATLAPQDHVQRSVPLYVTSQVGVDVSFTSVELTMSMDEFSQRHIVPAMSQLAAHIENACLVQAMKWVPNYTGTTSTQMTYKQFQQGGMFLSENLAPKSQRTALLNPASQVEFNDAVKGLYQQSQAIATQYREGEMGRTGGFDVMENTLIPTHTNSTYGGTSLVDGTNQGTTTTAATWASTTTIHTDGWTSGISLAAGTVITFSGVMDVHPETKVSTGRLKRFVLTADSGTASQTGGDLDITIAPAILSGAGNPYRNVNAAVADEATITVFGISATAYGQNLQYHKDAFTFATADLEDQSAYGAWGARDVLDGISMRIVQQYDIGTDTRPCRIDVLYGFLAQYPELAVRGFHALA
jgi:hypothetical protein